jgi:hypothetical protein
MIQLDRPISPDCMRTQLGDYGKAFGFDPSIVGQLYTPTSAAPTPSPAVSRPQYTNGAN